MDMFIIGQAHCLHKIFPQTYVLGADPCLPSLTTAAPKPQRSRPTNSRDERFRSGRVMPRKRGVHRMGAYTLATEAFGEFFFAEMSAE
jgi:hypothetical protein